MIFKTQEKPMSYPKDVKTSRRHLKNFLATALCGCLLGIAFLDAGICQTPGYGDKPDQWAPYESGPYFEQLQKIVQTYRFDGSKIAYLHFELTRVGVGPVELFRIPYKRSRDCNEEDCYFFVLVASDYSDAPLVTPCQFKQAALTHLFTPDGSRFFGFEFSCPEALLQVKVTPRHFMAIPVEKTR
jgi:hypothetical protein